jgi:RNA polymerase sigma-70 factor (ECF subfamily)
VATILGAGPDVDDVVQEAFVKAYGAMRRFRADAEFRPWLLRIVANECHNQRRTRRRRAAREQRLGGWRADLQAAGAEVVALDNLRDERLLTAVGALPESQRLVVACRYLLQLSEAETATVLKLPAGTVKSRLHRGLARLREEVADERNGS